MSTAVKPIYSLNKWLIRNDEKQTQICHNRRQIADCWLRFYGLLPRNSVYGSLPYMQLSFPVQYPNPKTSLGRNGEQSPSAGMFRH